MYCHQDNTLMTFLQDVVFVRFFKDQVSERRRCFNLSEIDEVNTLPETKSGEFQCEERKDLHLRHQTVPVTH